MFITTGRLLGFAAVHFTIFDLNYFLQMIRKLVPVFVISLLVIMILLGYFLLRGREAPAGRSLWEGTPPDAPAVMVVNDLHGMSSKLREMQSKQNLPPFSFLQQDLVPFLLQLDSLDPGLLKTQPFLISFHLRGKNHVATLLNARVPHGWTPKKIVHALASVFPGSAVSWRRVNGARVYELQNNKGTASFTCSLYKGHLFISNSAVLVEDAIQQIRDPKPFPGQESLRKAIRVAGKNVALTLFISYNRLPGLLGEVLRSGNPGYLNGLSGFAEWTAADMLNRDDMLIFTGATFSHDTLPSYMRLLMRQHPHEINAPRMMPGSTQAFILLSIDSAVLFHDYPIQVLNTAQRVVYKRALDNIKQQYNIDLVGLFSDLSGNQAAMCVTSDTVYGKDGNIFQFIRVTDPRKIEDKLSSISENNNGAPDRSGGNLVRTIRTEDGTPFRIYRSPIPFLPRYIFGSLFGESENRYFTLAGDYLIFGNSFEALAALVNDYVMQRTLFYDTEFNDFVDNFDTSANLFAWMKFSTNRPMQSLSFPDIFQGADVKGNAGLQLIRQNNYLFTNLMIQTRPLEETKPVSLAWHTAIDSTAVLAVNDRLNNNSRTHDLVALTADKMLARVTSDGRTGWQTELPGEPVSDLWQVDFYRNKKLQIMGCTRDKLFLIDRNGKSVENFPVKLPAPVLGKPALFDYENNRDYRIIYLSQNNQLICIDKSGKKVQGWNPPESLGVMAGEIGYFCSGKLEYIAVPSKKGWVLLNRRGGIRMTFKCSYTPSANPLFLEKRPTGDRLVGTDMTGGIYFMSFNGSCENQKGLNLDESHTFSLTDLNGDGQNDLLFADRDTVWVQNRKGENLMVWSAGVPVTESPVVFKSGTTDLVLGIWSKQAGKLWLVYPNGQIVNGFPVECTARPLLMPDYEGKGKMRVVVGNHNFLYNFIVQ